MGYFFIICGNYLDWKILPVTRQTKQKCSLKMETGIDSAITILCFHTVEYNICSHAETGSSGLPTVCTISSLFGIQQRT